MKRVLMIAYHYPPASISSGIQRTLKFSTYLPELGWQPSVSFEELVDEMVESDIAQTPEIQRTALV